MTPPSDKQNEDEKEFMGYPTKFLKDFGETGQPWHEDAVKALNAYRIGGQGKPQQTEATAKEYEPIGENHDTSKCPQVSNYCDKNCNEVLGRDGNYSNLKDGDGTWIRPPDPPDPKNGNKVDRKKAEFRPKQKNNIYKQNREKNNSNIPNNCSYASDDPEDEHHFLFRPRRVKQGEECGRQASIDHKKTIKDRGCNSYCNAQVISRSLNSYYGGESTLVEEATPI